MLWKLWALTALILTSAAVVPAAQIFVSSPTELVQYDQNGDYVRDWSIAGINSLAFQPGTNTLFAVVNGTLATIDTNTSTVTPVGSYQWFLGDTDLAFTPDGTLWATSGGVLATVDVGTGVVTPTGYSSNAWALAAATNTMFYGGSTLGDFYRYRSDANTLQTIGAITSGRGYLRAMDFGPIGDSSTVYFLFSPAVPSSAQGYGAGPDAGSGGSTPTNIEATPLISSGSNFSHYEDVDSSAIGGGFIVMLDLNSNTYDRIMGMPGPATGMAVLADSPDTVPEPAAIGMAAAGIACLLVSKLIRGKWL